MQNNIEDEIMQDIARKIKLLRKTYSVSQTNLAKILKVSFQQVQKYENATSKITATKLYIISKVFVVDFNFFYNQNIDIKIDVNILKNKELAIENLKRLNEFIK
jgi:transcriptional regulator with XRE-family HTH domain